MSSKNEKARQVAVEIIAAAALARTLRNEEEMVAWTTAASENQQGISEAEQRRAI
jgi:hypothetical protein